ncbi:MAG TPA: MASE1 domain-containing protein [Ktedonobacteraceae bacterium]|nr:MASE1 domain-containing protein [Ktedonobacteraceae bacterium]
MKRAFSLRLPRRTQGHVLYVGEISALAVVYFSAARFGLSLDAVSGFATLVWLPSGIAIATGLLFGSRLWPGLFLGAFLVNLLNGAPPLVAVGIGIGNTLEALVGTALLKRQGFSIALNHLRDVLLLVFLAMPVSALVSATIGVSSLLLGGVIAFSAFSSTWSAWWIGDMISILIITPLLLTWRSLPHENMPGKRWAELGLMGLFLLASGVIIFLWPFRSNDINFPRTYLMFPPLIWASLRFGQRGALTTILILSILAVVGTIEGLSPFSISNPGEGLASLQVFMGITAVTCMILAAMGEERREIERRKDEFINMASHELRTPLTSLGGYIELLQRKFARQDNQEELRILSKMETQTRQLSGLVADLLDLSKIQAGGLVFTEEPVDVNALVGEVVESLQQSSARHQICIEGSLQSEITGDRERLGQVLANLLTNAIKYSPGAEKIIVHLTHTQNELTVGVQDFGIGIPLAYREKVFERFYRVRNSQNQTFFPGLGMGLYIAHQIIERHGGKIWVESAEGQGSTFSFSLLIRDKNEENMAFSATSEKKSRV